MNKRVKVTVTFRRAGPPLVTLVVHTDETDPVHVITYSHADFDIVFKNFADVPPAYNLEFYRKKSLIVQGMYGDVSFVTREERDSASLDLP